MNKQRVQLLLSDTFRDQTPTKLTWHADERQLLTATALGPLPLSGRQTKTVFVIPRVTDQPITVFDIGIWRENHQEEVIY